MKHGKKQIQITFTFDSEKQAQVISESLQPEVKKDIPSVKITLEQKNNEILVHFQGDQTTNLRAAVNSYIRWIETAYSVERLKMGT